MIRRLPKDVVDRIAAGEVIERPSSVVKELIENALDAGATRVEVEIERGGRQSIRVSDDGCGIEMEELPLAFVAHATSKLTEVDDLLAIASFGFRGEALASIGAVSRARIVSRTAHAANGAEIVCDGGNVTGPKPCSAPLGTTVETQNLFFNVPARERFLKSDAAEASRCLDHVTDAALAHEGVQFRFVHGGRCLFEVAATDRRAQRFARAHGQELGKDLIHVARHVGEMHVEALLAPPHAARARATHQHLFMNGRPIKDGSLKAAVRQAYREFMAPALQPVFALFVTIDPGEVDVNVHPAKIEVRFRNGGAVFRAVQQTVLDALRSADLAPRPGAPPAVRPSGRTYAEARGGASTVREPMEASSSPLSPLPPGMTAPRPRTEPAVSRPDAAAPGTLFETAKSPPVPAVPGRTGRGWLRLFRTYIGYESGADFVLVDQHALHERVLYERMRRQVDGGVLKSQRLLVPVAVEVSRAETMRAEEAAEDLAQLGLEVSVLGDTTIAVHSVPVLLKDADVESVVRGALAEDAAAARERLDHRLHTMACHAAVRAGDVLRDEEIEALLDEAAQVPEAKACPHGRPTSVRVSNAELERWFKRSGF